jgi:surface antigen
MNTRFAPRFLIAAAMASALALSGCANDGRGGKETAGTLIGAGLGAWAGSAIGKGSGNAVAIAAGTLIGAAVGNSIGKSMDDVDRMRLREAEQRAYSAPIGETIVWENPKSGNYGRVTPVREGRSTGGRYCREFQSEITVGGKRENGHGTACQEPDGSWRITG